mmetsp:Transcript_23119/g.50071  ORF Transcript_23119/g.50071 Transcript_23119/m.50071 type:complete len:163 (+) Transcript_23119:104-592(+)|eukprot:CAMPEP_0172320612 /NCGR_PEP_ID=MMETSP1058-20130122/40944_1 /TAXON_ID=83371 /ORGANISM="Detonula confervacea, Strain CCMP 353" /LENGTH=162 /DNA_ID=CAMNT_0013035907 /DNA_START=18 /DNA_END=506 /DNA_ORIENTATION=-
MKTYAVSCHCGLIQAKFRREVGPLTLWDCNCSDCRMRRNLHFMVPACDFWLVDSTTGAAVGVTEDDASENVGASMTPRQIFERETILYQWGTKTAIRRFCRTCGVMPFYIPRSNPDGFAITFPCVDWGEDGPPKIEIGEFDGVNWEQSHSATGIAKETAKDS